jgi:uncharacterized protein (TIGR00255 family)
MIKSMTGFGQVAVTNGSLSISIEVKSLNSKFLDFSLRLPRKFSEKEIEIRNLVADKLERGKITLNVDIQESAKPSETKRYNEDLFVSYYTELKRLADRVMAGYDPIFQMALNSPDVLLSTSKEEVDPQEWEKIKQLTIDAIDKCEHFRIAEGNVLEEKIKEYIGTITSSLVAVEKIDPSRIEKIRTRIKTSITDFFGNEGFDVNRLEQEIIFYIEKLDIHEERVRLKTHLDYFLKLLSEKQSNGKKLGFLSQEIGREINTIGSKANDAEMQKHVVAMKEELEKIKEQLNNVL